jgi:uncharacterized repeat protein (TIGR01451 family)
MMSCVRPLARPLLMFTALVLLIGVLIQPTASSHAQGGSPPPPPTPTAGPTGDERPATSGHPIPISALDSAKNAPLTPTATAQPLVQKPASAAPLPAADSAPQGAIREGTVAPQATQPANTFHVNTIASATVAADGLLTYSIYFTNTASVTYQNVILQNGIGGGQRYTGCDNAATCPFTYTGNLDIPRPTIIDSLTTGNGGSYDARQIVWNLGTVQPGRTGRISYTVRVWREVFPQTERPPTILGNTVALYKDGAINSNNLLNEDQWGVLVVGPVFYMTKTVDKPAALEREQVRYTISIGNKTNPNDQSRVDARDAHTVKVVDIVPPQLTNIVPEDGGQVVPQGNGDIWVVWNIPLLAVGTSTVRHFKATIKDTLAECNTMSNGRYYVTSNEMPYADQDRYYIQGRGSADTLIPPPVVVDIQVTTTGTIYVGDTVSFLVTAKSYWDSDITNATVLFHVPSAFTYVSSSVGSVYSNGLVTWAGVTLPHKTDFNTPGLKQFTVQASAGRFIDSPVENHAFAEIQKPLPGGVPSDCLRPFDRGVDVRPLLYANKTVNVSTAVLSGTDVIYTVELLNISAQTLTNVTLVDNIPYPTGGPFRFKGMVSGSTPAPTSVTSTQVRWDGNLSVPGGTLNSPGRTTLRFTMTARGRPGECRDNHVFPDSPASQAHEVGGGNVCIAFPFGLTKLVDRTAVSPRDSNRTLQFTVRYKNLISTSLNITPRDLPEASYTFKQMLQGPQPNNGGAIVNGYISWPPITLQGNQTVEYIFTMDLPVGQDGAIPPGIYCNRGSMIVEPTSEYGPGWVSDPPACTVVSSLELHVEKWLDRHDIGLGELVTYGVNLSNNSDSAISQLVVSDTLPVNMSYVRPATGSLAPTVTTLPNGQQRLRWENVLVPAHTTTTVSFQARAPALIGTNRNVAEVSGGNPVPYFTCQYNPSPPGSCLGNADMNIFNLVTIDPQPEPPLAQPGSIVTYTVSLVSNNNIPYLNTTVTDTLPLGFTFLSMVSGPEPFRPRPDQLIWYNQSLPQKDGSNAGRLRYVFRARAPLSYGSFRMRVDASSPTGIIPTVDNAARVLIVPPTPALSLVAPTLVQVGSDVTFRISLVNPLATPLTGVTINHTLPTGFVYKSVETGTPAPTASGQTLTWNSVTVPARSEDGTPGIVELVVIATAPNTEGTATSTVTASGGGTSIDQTYNRVDMIIAQLRYVFLPIVNTTG